MRKTHKESLGELDKLTIGEVRQIERRRLGLNQTEMAAKRKISRNAYRALEVEGTIATVAEHMDVLPLTVGERCYLYRRRAKQTAEDVAAFIPCCKYWLRLMEQDRVPTDMLVSYWEQ